MGRHLAWVKEGQQLTAAEQLIFSLIYLRNNQISNILFVPLRTVEFRIECIWKKLGVQTRVAALWRGMAQGYKVDDRYLVGMDVISSTRGN